ncbi:MAG: glycosyltransferase [Chitinophagaceae bacterium]|nr:MAG: glycosyltransferase [Chitinophagaceae bacterium]
MSKKRIVHVIDDLSRGGAETLLVDLLPDLSAEYDIILVTLGDKVEFEPYQVVCKKKISLHYKGTRDLIQVSRRLRKIIKKYKPDLVRSQLYWSTIITRLAVSNAIPFFFSVHATMNDDPIAWHKRLFLKGLEKLTYRKWQNMIGVTEAVIDSFKAVHPQSGRTFLLHNFVRDSFFDQPYRFSYNRQRPLKLVTVSNLRLIKNIPYLIEALHLLPREKVTLDIYGDGPLKTEILQTIEKYGLTNVRLMGRRNDIDKVLPGYDVFVSPSTVEGFGIAVAEAMSIGLPVIISDIPVYREIGSNEAFYINKNDPHSLKEILQTIINGTIDLLQISHSTKQYAQRMFSKKGYMSKLNKIYETASSV